MDELTLWPEVPPARTSAWLDAVQDWAVNGAACSGTSAVSLLSALPVGFCGKTSLALCPPTTARTSPPCCGDSPDSDLPCPRTGGARSACASAPTGPPSGGCLTLDTSEWPNAAVECSLSQVLEPSVNPKYSLSPKACAGILARAERRGRGSTVGTLTTWSSGGWHVGVVEAAAGHLIRSTFDWQASADRQSIIDREDGPTRTLDSKTPAVAYPLAMRGRQDGAEMELGEPDVYNSLRAGDGGSSRQNAGLTPNLTVRRLTPRECERLMGWPDDWTRWRADGTEIADSHRYRLCGNGVVSAVTEWIGRRLAATTAREAAA